MHSPLLFHKSIEAIRGIRGCPQIQNHRVVITRFKWIDIEINIEDPLVTCGSKLVGDALYIVQIRYTWYSLASVPD